MQIYPIQMLQNALLTVIVGACLGILYDVLNALKLSIFSGKALKYADFIKDLFFFTALDLTFILVLYYFNDGAFRAVFLCALFLGIFLYKITFGKLVLKLTMSIIKIFKRMIGFALEPLVLIVKKTDKIAQLSFKALEKVLKRLYNKKEKTI